MAEALAVSDGRVSRMYRYAAKSVNSGTIRRRSVVAVYSIIGATWVAISTALLIMALISEPLSLWPLVASGLLACAVAGLIRCLRMRVELGPDTVRVYNLLNQMNCRRIDIVGVRAPDPSVEQVRPVLMLADRKPVPVDCLSRLKSRLWGPDRGMHALLDTLGEALGVPVDHRGDPTGGCGSRRVDGRTRGCD